MSPNKPSPQATAHAPAAAQLSHDQQQARDQQFWRRTQQWTALFLLAWFVTWFVMLYFAKELNQYRFLGGSVSFFWASQGAVVMFVLLIGLFHLVMSRLEREATKP